MLGLIFRAVVFSVVFLFVLGALWGFMTAMVVDDDTPWYVRIAVVLTGLLVAGGAAWFVTTIAFDGSAFSDDPDGSRPGVGPFEW